MTLKIELTPDELTELRAIKAERVRLMERRQDEVARFGLKYYDPHPKQNAFHRAGRFKRRAVFAGNRFGKSDCGCAEDCSQALTYRPWIPEGDPARTEGIPQRPQKILIITTDWDKVDEVFTNKHGTDTGKLWKMLPRGCVKRTKTNHSGAIETFVLENGSLIQFDTVESFKKNPQGAESSKWDVVHIDEPCPEKMFSAHARGLMDTDGQAYFTLTPLKEPWIYDQFYGDVEVTAKQIALGQPYQRKNDFWSITGSVWDNPYLTEAAIMRFLTEDCTDDERECREKGIPLQFAGLIYKEFESALHVLRTLPEGWDDFDSPPKSWPCYLQLDPHPQTPTAGLFTTVGPSGRKYVYQELFEKGIAEEIIKRVYDRAAGLHLINPQCDPSAFNEDELTGTCWADDFGAAGLWFSRAPKQLERGIVAVKTALKARFIDGSPVWMFSPYLRRFFFEIKRWYWTKENKPVDKDDHTLECFYRTVLSEPTFIERQPQTRENPVGDEPITGLSEDERWVTRNLYNLND